MNIVLPESDDIRDRDFPNLPERHVEITAIGAGAQDRPAGHKKGDRQSKGEVGAIMSSSESTPDLSESVLLT